MNLYAIPKSLHDTLNVDGDREYAKGNFTLRCQGPSDREKVYQICPRDQAKTFIGKWIDDTQFVFEEADPNQPAPVIDAEAVKLMAADVKELKSLAGEREVPWDNKASRETMVERIVAAGRK